MSGKNSSDSPKEDKRTCSQNIIVNNDTSAPVVATIEHLGLSLSNASMMGALTESCDSCLITYLLAVIGDMLSEIGLSFLLNSEFENQIKKEYQKICECKIRVCKCNKEKHRHRRRSSKNDKGDDCSSCSSSSSRSCDEDEKSECCNCPATDKKFNFEFDNLKIAAAVLKSVPSPQLINGPLFGPTTVAAAMTGGCCAPPPAPPGGPGSTTVDAKCQTLWTALAINLLISQVIYDILVIVLLKIILPIFENQLFKRILKCKHKSKCEIDIDLCDIIRTLTTLISSMGTVEGRFESAMQMFDLRDGLLARLDGNNYLFSTMSTHSALQKAQMKGFIETLGPTVKASVIAKLKRNAKMAGVSASVMSNPQVVAEGIVQMASRLATGGVASTNNVGPSTAAATTTTTT